MCLLHKSPSLFPIWHGHDIIFKVSELSQIVLKEDKSDETTDNFVSDHIVVTAHIRCVDYGNCSLLSLYA